jgi:hypothetical protein
MKPIFRKLIANFLVILIPTIFCTIMATPFSLLLPLNCPQGSRVIGIECFDGNYNNTTPWYRKDFGPSELAFPFLAVGFSAFAIWNFFTTPISEFDRSKKNAATGASNAPQLVQNSTGSKWDEIKQSALANPEQTIQNLKDSRTTSKQWLPEECPHCGGAITTQNVEWISDYEATCPYCGGVVKK